MRKRKKHFLNHRLPSQNLLVATAKKHCPKHHHLVVIAEQKHYNRPWHGIHIKNYFARFHVLFYFQILTAMVDHKQRIDRIMLYSNFQLSSTFITFFKLSLLWIQCSLSDAVDASAGWYPIFASTSESWCWRGCHKLSWLPTRTCEAYYSMHRGTHLGWESSCFSKCCTCIFQLDHDMLPLMDWPSDKACSPLTCSFLFWVLLVPGHSCLLPIAEGERHLLNYRRPCYRLYSCFLIFFLPYNTFLVFTSAVWIYIYIYTKELIYGCTVFFWDSFVFFPEKWNLILNSHLFIYLQILQSILRSFFMVYIHRKAFTSNA